MVNPTGETHPPVSGGRSYCSPRIVSNEDGTNKKCELEYKIAQLESGDCWKRGGFMMFGIVSITICGLVVVYLTLSHDLIQGSIINFIHLCQLLLLLIKTSISIYEATYHQDIKNGVEPCFTKDDIYMYNSFINCGLCITMSFLVYNVIKNSVKKENLIAKREQLMQKVESRRRLRQSLS